jgi:hypothetical protein
LKLTNRSALGCTSPSRYCRRFFIIGSVAAIGLYFVVLLTLHAFLKI